MLRPYHFELYVEDPEKAAQFYTQVFGWKVTKWDGPQEYYLVETGEGPGIGGGISSTTHKPHTINTIQVENLDEMLDKITAAGGTVVMDKMAVPGVGHMAYCTDSQGLMFGLMQEDPEAK